MDADALVGAGHVVSKSAFGGKFFFCAVLHSHYYSFIADQDAGMGGYGESAADRGWRAARSRGNGNQRPGLKDIGTEIFWAGADVGTILKGNFGNERIIRTLAGVGVGNGERKIIGSFYACG